MKNMVKMPASAMTGGAGGGIGRLEKSMAVGGKKSVSMPKGGAASKRKM